MKPNGIFYMSADRAAIAETQVFLKQRPKADLATQSGPMLVIEAAIEFLDDQGGGKWRSGMDR
jgi:uncharacterized protein YigE (DUF2233 family)